MTYKERLSEIENKFGDSYSPLDTKTQVPAEQDIRYLLTKVQTLTQAIEVALNESSWPLAKGILRRALEDQTDEI